MNKSITVAFSGVMSALISVLLMAGSVVWIFAYTMPLVCGLILLTVKESLGKKYAFIVYIASGIISSLLIGADEGIFMFILFFGYYPIIKDDIDRIKNKLLRILLKLFVFNSAMVLVEVIVTFVFKIPFEMIFGRFTVAFLLVSANIIFLAYEKLLFAVKIIYNKKLKKRIDKYLK